MNPSIRQVKLYSLSEDCRRPFQELIYPKSYDLFDAPDKERVIAFGAFVNEHPIGLITCFAYFQAKEALLASFAVLPSYQNQGIGQALMRSLLHFLKEKGIHLVYFHYQAPAPALESLLQKTGWPPSQLLVRRYYLDQYSFQPDWYFSPFPLLPDEFTIFPWSEVTLEEIALAEQWERGNPQMSLYSIHDPKHAVDTLTSLGLRQNGKLAGWIINHRLEPKLLRYSAFYLIPEIRGLGPGIYLLRESIRLHFKNEIDLVGTMEINFKLSSRSWLRFIQKRLAPFATRTEDFYYAYQHTVD